MPPKSREENCMFPDCNRKKGYTRGVCGLHYRLMWVEVAKKEKTWEMFERAGYVLEPKKRKSTLSRDFWEKVNKIK